MQVTVFGANGRVGQKIVRQLLDDSDQVRAFVHHNNQLPKNPKLTVVQGDIRDQESVGKAIAGSDAVLSALGSWGTKTKDIQVAGMMSIIPAMKQAKVSRIVSVTGTGAFIETDNITFAGKAGRFLIGAFMGKILRDGEIHMQMLKESGLDWTVVRAPAMVEKGKAGDFQLSDKFPLPWATITRQDVATAMVSLAKSDEWLHAAPIISHK